MFKGNFWKIKRIKCQDGSVKQIFKNPDDAFPLLVKSYDANLTTKLKSDLLYDGELTGSIVGKVDALLFGLNDINSGVMMAFRSAYVGYAADPCGHGIDFLRTEIVKINDEQRHLKKLAMQIRGYVELAKSQLENSDDARKLYIDLINSMRSPTTSTYGAVEAIQASRSSAQSLMGAGQ